MAKRDPIPEQLAVLENDKKNMLVSASAGSGKTFIMIEYVAQLVVKQKIPVQQLLVLTYTKAAATEMKERLLKKLKEESQKDLFVVEQIDNLSTANICTIHAYCEKCIKKYANLLDINESFEVLDENAANKLKSTAFVRAFEKMKECHSAEYQLLVEIFKNDKEKIKTMMLGIEELANSVSDKEEFLTNNVKNMETYFDQALQFLCENLKEKIQSKLHSLECLHAEDYYDKVRATVLPVLNAKDLFEIATIKECLKYPNKPSDKLYGKEIATAAGKIKDSIKKMIDEVEKLDLQDEVNVDKQRAGEFEKLLLKLFDIYEKEQEELKKLKNCLTFSDFEKYMSILSKQEDLFSNLKYVFVDEYQDTNKMQERIVKNVAKNCNFVAVGDAKQGIYGFRLASFEIFLKDTENFSKDENSTVKNLKTNFRSSQHILSFVNKIFEVCMTKEYCGIDYKKDAMLKEFAPFGEDGQKAINIDLIEEEKVPEKELPQIYSVKEDELVVKEKKIAQLVDIRNKIVEVMQTSIYENKQLRRCQYKDIAILFRERNGLFNQLEKFLIESGIPVVSNSKNVLLEEAEIQVLLNLLKLALNVDDDIALLSVINSPFCNIDFFEVVKEKASTEKTLCQLVVEDEKGLFAQFNQTIADFSKNIQIFGARSAFLKLFDKVDYRAYINTKPNQHNLNNYIDTFLSEIDACDLGYDLPGLINYFESVKITVQSQPSSIGDAVLLTTIHNSKGLEYPIVFMAECDKKIRKNDTKSTMSINERFGFAAKLFDQEENTSVDSVRMKAIKESKRKKEFIEELMIFYVALTRPKNRLYLFGEFSDKIFEDKTLDECECYFDLIFYALKKEKFELMANGRYEDENTKISFVGLEQEKTFAEKQSFEMAEYDSEIVQKIEKYLNFEYKYSRIKNFKLKESVTGLSKKHDEDQLLKYSNDNFVFSNNMVEIGNAYHLALKLIDFAKVSDEQTLHQELQKWNDVLQEGASLIDEKVLLRNILLLKQVVGDGVVFKEKDFITKDSICNLIEGEVEKDEIFVQGIIDLFVVKGDEIVLIDYKYSNSTSDDYLVDKYKNQLKLYKNSLKNAFSKQINDVYLLSLKHSKLIKVDI